MHVCLLMPCGHLLGKGLSNCDVVNFPSVSMVRCLVDCIESWSLPSFLLPARSNDPEVNVHPYTGHSRLRTGCYPADHLWRWGTWPHLGPIPGAHRIALGLDLRLGHLKQLVSHELIHLWVDPLIPLYSNLCNSLLCGALSKALAKSIMTKYVCFCHQFTAPSRLLMMSCTNWTNWVSQDLWLRKPCWQSVSMLSKA